MSSGLAIVSAAPGSVGELLATRFETRGVRVVRASGEEAIAAARAAGALDVLVTDPGQTGEVDATTLDYDTARQALHARFDEPVALTLAVWPELAAAQGRVITVTGPLGVLASARAAGLSAPEHALVSWARAFSASAGRRGVQALTAHVDARDPDAAARAILRALDAGRHECWHPASLRGQAIVQGLLPGSLGRRLAARR